MSLNSFIYSYIVNDDCGDCDALFKKSPMK